MSACTRAHTSTRASMRACTHTHIHTHTHTYTHTSCIITQACVVFFDEVDAIGGARFDDGAGGDNEVQRTMLEIVNQLDGFDARGNVKVWSGDLEMVLNALTLQKQSALLFFFGASWHAFCKYMRSASTHA
eukprot:1157754-Pelagomonas_calceolata.AAC.3